MSTVLENDESYEEVECRQPLHPPQINLNGAESNILTKGES